MYVPLKKPNILLCLCSIGIIRQNMDNQTSTWSPVLFSGGPETIFPRGNILHLTHVIKIAIPLLLFFVLGRCFWYSFHFLHFAWQGLHCLCSSGLSRPSEVLPPTINPMPNTLVSGLVHCLRPMGAAASC